MLGDKDKKFAEEMVTIEGTAAAAETLADKLLQMGDTSKMTAEQYSIWKGTADELVKLVPSLSGVINTETGEIKANSKEIQDNIKEWERLAKQKALQTLKEEKLTAIMEKNHDLVDKSIEANKKAAEAAEAKTKAEHEFSDEMKARGYGELDFSGDVDQQISDLFTRLSEMGDAGESDAMALGLKLKGIGEASLEAGKAAEEVKKLETEIAEGKKEYDEWLAAAQRLYGGLDEDAASATAQAQALKDTVDSIPDYKHITLMEQRMFPHAIGSAYIPYDNYPALLHRGEKVLTATQARQESGGADLTHLEDRIAAAVRAGMDGVTVNSYIDGKQVTDNVNRRNMREVKGRRFA